MRSQRHYRKQEEARVKLLDRLAHQLDPTPAQTGATEEEKDVKALESVLEGFELSMVTGLWPPAQRRQFYWQTQKIEGMLLVARRELRFARGDY